MATAAVAPPALGADGRGEFARGGGPLFAATVGVACGASPIPFNVLPVALGPIHAQTGWSFAVIAGGITVFGVIASVTAPFVGALADRIGVRPVALASLALFGLVFATMALLPLTLPAWFGFWAALGLIGIGSTPVTWSRAIALWFNRHRGLALGIMLLGTSAAGLVVPLVARLAIAEGGWRLAFPVLALLPLLVALPVGLWLFREPPMAARAHDASPLPGLTLAQTLSGYRFWVLFVSILLTALAYGGAHIHMAQIVGLHGFGAGAAAGTVSVVALGILAGRVVTGLLFDRLWAPAVACPVLLLPALACLVLMGSGSAVALVLGAAFLLGFAAGAESDVIAYLASRYFGMAFYGRIYGLLYLAFGLGSAVSPILYGLCRDRTGNYDLMLRAAAALFAVGGLLLLTLGRYPRFADTPLAETFA